MELKAPGIEVEVIYALPAEQALLTVRVPPNATVRQAIVNSGVLERYQELDLTQIKIGVFGKCATLDTVLRAGDRVEIYRRLTVDPKEARRRRNKRRGR